MITVFYGDQVWDDYPNWLLTERDKSIPSGAYAYDAYNQLWWQLTHTWISADLNEVPAMCKAWLLILGD